MTYTALLAASVLLPTFGVERLGRASGIPAVIMLIAIGLALLALPITLVQAMLLAVLFALQSKVPVALALDRGLTVRELLRLPFYHPVLEEGLRSALRDLAAQLPAAGDSDLPNCAGFETIGAEALE